MLISTMNKIRDDGIATSNIHPYEDQSNVKTYCITKIGYETIRFYLNPGTGYLIRNMLFALKSYFSKTNVSSSDLFRRISIPRKISMLSFIHTLMHAKELQNLWKTTRLKRC